MKNSYINKIGQVIQPKDLEKTMDEINGAVDKADLYPIPKNADKGKYLKYDESGKLIFGDVASGMENPMTTADDIIVGGASGAPTRLAKGTQGQVLKVGPSGLEWGNENREADNVTYLTTAPSSANTDGLKFVVLSAEPATKYNGYIYFITT